MERSPSFRGFRAASEASSYAKKMNRDRDTVHERSLRSWLWRNGLRFRKNVGSLPGKPDIVFTREKLAIFCDGDFWHGRDWRRLREKLRGGSNASYWLQKIASNRRRDIQNNHLLRTSGWRVLRIWESEIKHDPSPIVQRIIRLVKSPV